LLVEAEDAELSLDCVALGAEVSSDCCECSTGAPDCAAGAALVCEASGWPTLEALVWLLTGVLALLPAGELIELLEAD